MLRPLLLALLAAATAGGAPDEPASPIEAGDVVAFELPEAPGMRREHFVLRDGREVLGLVSTFVGPRGDDLRAERTFELFEIETSVRHVETLTPRGPRLVWREVRERSGRTSLVEWSEDGERVVRVDWLGGEAERRESSPESGALLPLFLIDSVREGQFPAGRFDVVDAPSGGIEELDVRVAVLPLRPRGLVCARRLVLSRPDGSLAGDYLFLGRELALFRLQEGGPVARRVSAARYRELERAEDERRARAGS